MQQAGGAGYGRELARLHHQVRVCEAAYPKSIQALCSDRRAPTSAQQPVAWRWDLWRWGAARTRAPPAIRTSSWPSCCECIVLAWGAEPWTCAGAHWRPGKAATRGGRALGHRRASPLAARLLHAAASPSACAVARCVCAMAAVPLPDAPTPPFPRSLGSTNARARTHTVVQVRELCAGGDADTTLHPCSLHGARAHAVAVGCPTGARSGSHARTRANKQHASRPHQVRRFEEQSLGLAPGAVLDEASQQAIGRRTGMLAAAFSFAQCATSLLWGLVSNLLGRKVAATCIGLPRVQASSSEA